MSCGICRVFVGESGFPRRWITAAELGVGCFASRCRPWPRWKPGVRRGPGRLRRPTAKGWSYPIADGSGWATRWPRWGSIGVERVWDLARTREGILLAATGDGGKVMGREPKAGASWSVVYDCSAGAGGFFQAGDTQVLSLVVTPEGISYCGHGTQRAGHQPDGPQASRFAA